jgi:hypothetical protein
MTAMLQKKNLKVVQAHYVYIWKVCILLKFLESKSFAKVQRPWRATYKILLTPIKSIVSRFSETGSVSNRSRKRPDIIKKWKEGEIANKNPISEISDP